MYVYVNITYTYKGMCVGSLLHNTVILIAQ